jgi:hypothetical protein
MRWLVLLPFLAACSTTTYEMGGDAWPVVLEELRRPVAGRAIVVADDRGYYVREKALRAEIDAFTGALADAAAPRETRLRMEPPSIGVTTVAHGPDDVTAYPVCTRRLVAGALSVKAVRLEDRRRYVVSFEQRGNHYLSVWVHETPAIERAWRNLARRARTVAGPVFPHMGELLEVPVFVRDVGVAAD